MPVNVQRRNTLVTVGLGALGLAWFATQSGKGSAARIPVPEIDVQAARALLEAGAMAIDVRGRDPYEFRHLPAAVLFPLAVLEAGIPAELSQAKERQIIVYCNDGHFTGPEATRILRENGFRNAVNLKSGVEGWAAAGLPLNKGPRA